MTTELDMGVNETIRNTLESLVESKRYTLHNKDGKLLSITELPEPRRQVGNTRLYPVLTGTRLKIDKSKLCKLLNGNYDSLLKSKQRRKRGPRRLNESEEDYLDHCKAEHGPSLLYDTLASLQSSSTAAGDNGAADIDSYSTENEFDSCVVATAALAVSAASNLLNGVSTLVVSDQQTDSTTLPDESGSSDSAAYGQSSSNSHQTEKAWLSQSIGVRSPCCTSPTDHVPPLVDQPLQTHDFPQLPQDDDQSDIEGVVCTTAISNTVDDFGAVQTNLSPSTFKCLTSRTTRESTQMTPIQGDNIDATRWSDTFRQEIVTEAAIQDERTSQGTESDSTDNLTTSVVATHSDAEACSELEHDPALQNSGHEHQGLHERLHRILETSTSTSERHLLPPSIETRENDETEISPSPSATFEGFPELKENSDHHEFALTPHIHRNENSTEILQVDNTQETNEQVIRISGRASHHQSSLSDHQLEDTGTMDVDKEAKTSSISISISPKLEIIEQQFIFDSNTDSLSYHLNSQRTDRESVASPVTERTGGGISIVPKAEGSPSLNDAVKRKTGRSIPDWMQASTHSSRKFDKIGRSDAFRFLAPQEGVSSFRSMQPVVRSGERQGSTTNLIIKEERTLITNSNIEALSPLSSPSSAASEGILQVEGADTEKRSQDTEVSDQPQPHYEGRKVPSLKPECVIVDLTDDTMGGPVRRYPEVDTTIISSNGEDVDEPNPKVPRLRTTVAGHSNRLDTNSSRDCHQQPNSPHCPEEQQQQQQQLEMNAVMHVDRCTLLAVKSETANAADEADSTDDLTTSVVATHSDAEACSELEHDPALQNSGQQHQGSERHFLPPSTETRANDETERRPSPSATFEGFPELKENSDHHVFALTPHIHGNENSMEMLQVDNTQETNEQAIHISGRASHHQSVLSDHQLESTDTMDVDKEAKTSSISISIRPKLEIIEQQCTDFDSNTDSLSYHLNSQRTDTESLTSPVTERTGGGISIVPKAEGSPSLNDPVQRKTRRSFPDWMQASTSSSRKFDKIGRSDVFRSPTSQEGVSSFRLMQPVRSGERQGSTTNLIIKKEERTLIASSNIEASSPLSSPSSAASEGILQVEGADTEERSQDTEVSETLQLHEKGRKVSLLEPESVIVDLTDDTMDGLVRRYPEVDTIIISSDEEDVDEPNTEVPRLQTTMAGHNNRLDTTGGRDCHRQPDPPLCPEISFPRSPVPDNRNAFDDESYFTNTGMSDDDKGTADELAERLTHNLPQSKMKWAKRRLAIQEGNAAHERFGDCIGVPGVCLHKPVGPRWVYVSAHCNVCLSGQVDILQGNYLFEVKNSLASPRKKGKLGKGEIRECQFYMMLCQVDCAFYVVEHTKEIFVVHYDPRVFEETKRCAEELAKASIANPSLQ